MTISGSTTFNGLFIKNDNLLLDAATTIISGGDWTFQLYYKAPQYTNDVKLFYISDDSFGVYTSAADNNLYLYFNNDTSGVTTIPLNIQVNDLFTCYTFIKSGNNFYVLVDGGTGGGLNVIVTHEFLGVFDNISYSGSIDYMCISPTQPNYISSCNFVCFWNIALSNQFVNTYYQYVYPNDSSGLLFNIRGDIDYTSNNNILERDTINSSLISIDICSYNGGGI